MKRTISQLIYDLLDREGILPATEIAKRLGIKRGTACSARDRWKKDRKAVRRKPRIVDVPFAKRVAPAEVTNIMRSKRMKNQVKLKQAGVEDEVRYYYLKFGEGASEVPDGYLGIATICLVPFEGVITRGIAFCSPRDQFNKRLGRNIALGRAIKAFCNACSSEPIPESTPAKILRHLHPSRGGFMDFFSTYSPKLTDYEQKLMGSM